MNEVGLHADAGAGEDLSANTSGPVKSNGTFTDAPNTNDADDDFYIEQSP